MVADTYQVIEQQQALNNPATRFFVDKYETTDIRAAKKQVRVVFGNFIERRVIREIEITLRRNIIKNTNTKTGKLSDIRHNWQLKLLRGGKNGTAVPINPYRMREAMGVGDRLILEPTSRISNSKGEMYATAVNKRVTSRGNFSHTPTRGKNKGQTQLYRFGFLRQTTRELKRKTLMRGYRIYAGFTVAKQVLGEVSKYGTGYIMLSVKSTGRYSNHDFRAKV